MADFAASSGVIYPSWAMRASTVVMRFAPSWGWLIGS